MDENSYFSSSYKEARDKFITAVRRANGSVDSIKHPEVGPESEPLFMDVAYFGSADSLNTLVVCSGTHGVEGFAGSGIQTGLLTEELASRLPPNLSLIMIHALNPYGMAHYRRSTEDNVDLNRNFKDHAQPFPRNLPYEALADAIAPRSISFWPEVKSCSRLLWYRVTAGTTAFQAAVCKGQYSFPTGLFYGGNHNTWSNNNLRSVIQHYLYKPKRAVFVDIHTGLGNYGSAEIILNSPSNSPEYRYAIDIWGPEWVRTTVKGKSVSVHLETTMKLAFPKMLPYSEVIAVSLEFGTKSPMVVLKALREENWLHHYGTPEHAKARQIKACLFEAFYPDDKNWKASVWTKGKQVVELAVNSFKTK